MVIQSTRFSRRRWPALPGYNGAVVLGRFVLLILYASYLTYAGLFFLVAPWSQLWGTIVVRFPVGIALFLGHPFVKGAISAFGLLHFALAAVEALGGLRSSGIRP